MGNFWKDGSLHFKLSEAYHQQGPTQFGAQKITMGSLPTSTCSAAELLLYELWQERNNAKRSHITILNYV